MADCFSLLNAAELVAKMRDYADTAEDNIYGICVNTPNVLRQAADAIEQLVQENAKLKAELDVAVEDIIIACRGERTLCGMCGNNNCEYTGDNQTYCYKCTKYKWRGVQKEEEDATD